MVDARAEEDDDDTFGDFSFASSVPINNKYSHQINDDDDWGDFVESPLRSDLSVAFSGPNTHRVKPNGALPPSLFGGDETEEEVVKKQSSALDPPVTNGSSKIVLNDVNSTIYNQNQVKGKNEFNLNTDGSGLDVNLTNPIGTLSDLKLNFSEIDLNSNTDQAIRNYDHYSPKIKNVNGLNPNSDSFAQTSVEKEALSGLSSDFDLFSANNATHISRDTNLSGLSLDSDLFVVGNGSRCPQMKYIGGLNTDSDSLFQINDRSPRIEAVSELNSGVDLFSSNNGGGHQPIKEGGVVNSENRDMFLFNGTIDNDVFSAFDSQRQQIDVRNITGASLKENASKLNLTGSESNFGGLISNSNMSNGKEELDADDDDWEFKDANLEQNIEKGSDHKNVPKSVDLSRNEDGVLASDDIAQGNDVRPNNHRAALPLALFGDEELETDDSLTAGDNFAYEFSIPKGSVDNKGSNYSIHDLVSNLYSQSQQIPSVEIPEKLMEDSGNDDFDDASWEFKGASAQSHASGNFSAHSEPKTHLNFYCKLKDELLLVCRCHLDNLEKAQNYAALSGDDAKVAAIEEEIQEAYKEFQKERIDLDNRSDDQIPGEICWNEFLEVLRKPNFQVLESKHQLSRKLLSAEKNQASAIEAMKHTMRVLNILTTGSAEDQCKYVSMWHKIISICAEELKHGSHIWNRSVEKNLQSWMLSESRGKDFILSLGEVYRVVTVLGLSTKLYEPWILSSSTYCTGVFTALEECHTLWSSSGIEEALQSLFDSIDIERRSRAEKLLNSIKSLRDLDEPALPDLVFNRQVSLCRISLLNLMVVPDMKLVMWNGGTYFVTLANLWANLISCDSPELTFLHVGS